MAEYNGSDDPRNDPEDFLLEQKEEKLSVPTGKFAYLCGKLTGLPPDKRQDILLQYEDTARDLKSYLGIEVYLPHKVSDPVAHKNWTPAQIDDLDRRAVSMCSFVIAFVDFDSVGAGIEIEMAHHANKPVFLLVNKCKLNNATVSRLTRGNPAIAAVIDYTNHTEMMLRLYRTITQKATQYKHMPECLHLF